MRLQDPVTRLPALALIVGIGALGAYLAWRAGGPPAGVLALAAADCGAALVLVVEPRSVDSAFARDAFDGLVFALPGALTVYFSFNAGGYLPSAPAFVAITLALLLVLRVTIIDAPFAGFSAPLGLAVGALALYAVWTLLSAGWSDASARALIEFDRALVYLFALLLFGSIPRTSARMRWVVRGLAAGIILVAAAALATRVLPDVFPTAPDPIGNERLGYPIGYSNAVGMLCMIGAILSLHIAASLHEPVAVRVVASAALPILGSTVVLTQSRGAIGAGAIGLVAYVVLGRPRGLLPALIAAVPATIVAVYGARDAELLTRRDFPTAAAVVQGHDVATTVALCVLAAAALRLLLWPLDARLRRLSLPSHLRPAAQFAGVASVAVVLAVAVVAGAPGWVESKYDSFLHGQSGEGAETSPGDAYAAGGRSDYWKVAMRGFRARELRGQGAGTYEYSWTRERPAGFGADHVTDAHSLYAETLHDLGLVGLVLLGAALIAILASLAPVKRGYNRSLYAALFAAGLAWAIHAGLDWNWELPAVTIWLFAVGGVALASRRRETVDAEPTQGARVVVALLLLVATVGPGLVLVSQRQLDESVDAFKRGECSQAIERAAASVSTLEGRAEPYEVLAYCQVRSGKGLLAVRAMKEAVEREPANARFRYGLALVRGAAGLDPRRAARAARRLDPQGRNARELVAELAKATPAERRRLSAFLARNQRSLAVVR